MKRTAKPQWLHILRYISLRVLQENEFWTLCVEVLVPMTDVLKWQVWNRGLEQRNDLRGKGIGREGTTHQYFADIMGASKRTHGVLGNWCGWCYLVGDVRRPIVFTQQRVREEGGNRSGNKVRKLGSVWGRRKDDDTIWKASVRKSSLDYDQVVSSLEVQDIKKLELDLKVLVPTVQALEFD